MKWMDVDTAIASAPVNILALVDDTTFKDIEAAIVYNSAGMALYWHFTTTAGVTTKTQVTPTTSGDYDWSGDGTDPDGMYTIEIPASGGASINNDTEGVGHFTGVATGVLPWRGPDIGFRAAALNNSLIDGATVDVNVTAMAANVLTAAAINAAAITAAKFAEDAIDQNAVKSDALDDVLASSNWQYSISQMYTLKGAITDINIVSGSFTGTMTFEGWESKFTGAKVSFGTLTDANVSTPNGAATDSYDWVQIPASAWSSPVDLVIEIVDANGGVFTVNIGNNDGATLYILASGAVSNTANDIFQATADSPAAMYWRNSIAAAVDGINVAEISGDPAAADRLELFSEYQSYPGRRVHVSTVDGAAGTTDHENGTLLNPSSVWADAISLAASLNLSGYHMYPGTSITLTQDHANNILCGESWTIVTGGYDLSNSYIYDAFVNGGVSTSDTQNSNFVRCLIWGHTSGSAVFRECAIANDFTIGEAGSYTFVDCFEAGGISQSAIDFAALGASNVQMDRYSGVVELKNMAAGDVVNLYGHGGIIINANCSDGTINRIAGNWDITDNASGNVTITNEVARFATDQQITADVTAISGDSDAADNLELQYDGTGLLGDTFPSTQVQLATIGGGVTLAQAAESKSLTDGAETNDYDATASHDGTLYIVTDDDNSDPGIDVYLQYDIAGNQAVSHVHFHGWYQDGSAPFTNSCYMQARDWESAAWDTIETLTHSTSEQEHEPTLLARHKSTTSNGPGGDEGVVRIRYVMAAQDGGAGSTINLDHVTVQYVNPAITAADVWAYILTELAVDSDPGATPTAAEALMLEYMKSRNRHDGSTTEEAIYNSAGAKILERDLTYDGTTASASKVRNVT